MSNEILDSEMQADTNSGVEITKECATYMFTGMDKEKLADKVSQYLGSKGYKLETGDKFLGKYGKGSKVGRILLGAMIKRFCWEIRVEQSKDKTRLMLVKDAKGIAGGLIGINQMNNEYALITESLKAWHAKVSQR